jgi:hypothetical protein
MGAPVVSAADLAATAPSPVRASMQTAIDRFTGRVEASLNQDAMSIARGKTPVKEGDPLSDAQRTELGNAANDFVRDLPIGAFSPEVAADIQRQLDAAGATPRDVASARLGDLGPIGRDIAKGLLANLRTESPTSYYSLAATAAAAIAYTGWDGGSAKLERLGIKPEVSTSFLDDHLELKLKGNWQSHFKDFSATATVTGKLDLGDAGRLSGSVSANSATGFQDARVDYSVSRDTWNLSTYATANREGLQSLGGTAAWNPSDNLRLSATVDHNFQTDRTTATAEAAYKVNDNVDLALSGSVDSAGESRVGAGLRISF